MRLGILGSTRGRHLLTLVQAIAAQHLQASIEIVISNKADAGLLNHAKKQGIFHQFLDPIGITRETYDAKLSALFREAAIDVIVLIGYMRILSADFVTTWQQKIINIHPSLLPAFAGLMDMDVHRAVLASGAKETGCTVHYVTANVDEGPILLQTRCPVYATDTAEQLKERVQHAEGETLVRVLNQLGAGCAN